MRSLCNEPQWIIDGKLINQSELTKKELMKFSRNHLIEWLCLNDSNGVYRDKDTRREFGSITPKRDLVDTILRQLEL